LVAQAAVSAAAAAMVASLEAVFTASPGSPALLRGGGSLSLTMSAGLEDLEI